MRGLSRGGDRRASGRPRRRDPSSDPAPRGHLLPQGEKGRVVESVMANAKKGHLVAATEWWKRLRWTKRASWKRQRQADKREGQAQPEDA